MAISFTEQTQEKVSYTIKFTAASNVYTIGAFPNSYFVATIYRNGVAYHISPNIPQGLYYPYTFNEASIEDEINYSVSYTIYSGINGTLYPPEILIEPELFDVLEYKPTFTLPTITCVQLNESTTFYPSDWNQNENDLCPINPETQQIEYKRYEFNLDTSTYEDVDEDDGYSLASEDGLITNPESYAYVWTPTKLAMVKIVVKVTNCSTTVEKATVFPVCGSWKIRRLACGDYRIYNYKNTNITFNLFKGVSSTSPLTGYSNIPVPFFSYKSLQLPENGIYKIEADGITQYIFNYCDIEACMLDLHKRVLLDETLCDECKMDKVLYQKALRLLPTYETWKKLLDKDWVYDMQYKTTDIAGKIAPELYDAEELYLELKNLCVDCGDSTTKKCKC